jgi:hypothetical protein
MATMSIRGLQEQALEQLKRQAQQEGSSLNSLVLRLLQGTPKPNHSGGLQKFTDLDGLAGTWTAQALAEFDAHTAAFNEVDPALWK